MMSLVIGVHILVCVLLIILVLIQRGRGGGLVESFSGVESMFGTRTNVFLTRFTTVLSIIFFFTCLSLALLSIKQSKSLMRQRPPESAAPAATQAPKAEAPKAEAPKPEAPKAESAPKPEAQKGETP